MTERGHEKSHGCGGGEEVVEERGGGGGCSWEAARLSAEFYNTKKFREIKGANKFRISRVS